MNQESRKIKSFTDLNAWKDILNNQDTRYNNQKNTNNQISIIKHA